MNKINWTRLSIQVDINPVLKHFERWMIDRDYRDASIDNYLKAIRLYHRTLRTITPSIEDAREYHSNMAASSLARATVKIRRAALIAFYKSQGLESRIALPKAEQPVPYFFDENDAAAILNSCKNFKHYGILNLMFHCMLRVSDLCNIEDADLDLKTLTLRIRDDKGGKSALLQSQESCEHHRGNKHDL